MEEDSLSNSYPEETKERILLFNQLEPGLSPAQVVDVVGPPDSIYEGHEEKLWRGPIVTRYRYDFGNLEAERPGREHGVSVYFGGEPLLSYELITSVPGVRRFFPDPAN